MFPERLPDRRHPLSYQAGGAHVIAAEGRLDLPAVADIERAAAAVPEHNRGPIVVDLTAAKPVGDVELTALFNALLRVRRRGASVAVVGAAQRASELPDAASEGLTFTTTVREALTVFDPVPSTPCGPSLPPPAPPRRRAAYLTRTQPSLAGEELS